MARPEIKTGLTRHPQAPEQSHHVGGLGIAVGVRTHVGPVLSYDQEVVAAYANVETTIAADAANFWTCELKAGATVIASVSSETAPIAAGTELAVTAANASLGTGTALTAVWTSTGAPADLSAKRLSVTAACTATDAA